MAEIINFEQKRQLRKELETRIDAMARLYVDVFSEFGVKMYGENFFENEECYELFSNLLADAITKEVHKRTAP